jgi:hypothetical protein
MYLLGDCRSVVLLSELHRDVALTIKLKWPVGFMESRDCECNVLVYSNTKLFADLDWALDSEWGC